MRVRTAEIDYNNCCKESASVHNIRISKTLHDPKEKNELPTYLLIIN